MELSILRQFYEAGILLQGITVSENHLQGLTIEPRFQAIYVFTIELLKGSTIIGNFCQYLRPGWFTPPPWSP